VLTTRPGTIHTSFRVRAEGAILDLHAEVLHSSTVHRQKC
jgi:hypothetical protein